MTDERLLKSFKVLSALTYLLAGVLLILFIACTFYIAMYGFSAIFLTPLGLLAILLINFSNMNRMRKELNARGVKGSASTNAASSS